MEEVTLEMGLQRLVDMSGSDKSTNKGPEQKHTDYLQEAGNSSLWLGNKE